MTILLTGFGQFPGALVNPTGALVHELAQRRTPAGVRRAAHVFTASYAAVDRELPVLVARERPKVLLMFGLAAGQPTLRVETRARNALAQNLPDAEGARPTGDKIVPAGPPELTLPAPAQQLVNAAIAAGVTAVLSRDAGDYVCNYLCWRACEAQAAAGMPRIVAFVHVPQVDHTCSRDDLVRAGEAMVQAAVAALPAR